MPRFTTRVELYGSPSAETYNKLHIAMKGKGFSQLISYDGKTNFYLPHAEYNLESTKTTKEVLQLAIEAARTIWSDFAVLVTSTLVTREWHNLKEAK